MCAWKTFFVRTQHLDIRLMQCKCSLTVCNILLCGEYRQCLSLNASYQTHAIIKNLGHISLELWCISYGIQHSKIHFLYESLALCHECKRKKKKLMNKIITLVSPKPTSSILWRSSSNSSMLALVCGPWGSVTTPRSMNWQYCFIRSPPLRTSLHSRTNYNSHKRTALSHCCSLQESFHGISLSHAECVNSF